VRTEGDPNGWRSAIRQAVLSVDKDQPLFDEKSLQEVLAAAVTRSTVVMRSLGFASLIALLLACTGIYGMASYVVSQRTRETGIRMALGAEPHQLVRLQLLRSMKTVSFGSLLGIGVSLAVTPILRSMLVGVTTADAITFATAPLLFLLTAGFASFLAAHRAVRINPLNALRQD
jgi:ABC-type antimicrobial peptide transport system permease subunit